MEVFNELEDKIIAAVTTMRDKLSDLEDPPSYFDFNVCVSGRVMDGDLEVTYTFDGGSYSKTTKGGNITKTFEEYMRRFDWNKRNQPLCLPKVPDTKEEVPF